MMFSSENYLVFDKGTGERLRLLNINMDTVDVEITAIDSKNMKILKKEEELDILEKVFELHADECGNSFNVYKWDVVKNNRTGRMFNIQSQDTIVEVNNDFDTKRCLYESELEKFEESTYIRLGNMYDVEFVKLVEKTRKQNKVDMWKSKVYKGCTIHAKHRDYKHNKFMVVGHALTLDNERFYMVNKDTGAVLPIFVGKCKTDAIDYVVDVLKYTIVNVE